MAKHTLWVCKSCSASIDHDDVTDDTVTEGVLLLRQLQELQQTGSLDSSVAIQAVGCLWTCDRPCSVTFVCPGKYTYHFAGIDQDDSAADLQQFSQLYLKSADGYVKPLQMPETLRSQLLVRIPPTP